MTKDDIFSAWAPDSSPWSRWAKPVLFAHMTLARISSALPEMVTPMAWTPPARDKVALVLDLPGADSVIWAVTLAGHGYRPVPLFNALPLPIRDAPADDTGHANVAAVDMFPILDALSQGASRLKQLTLPLDAPPVFLLDANRHGDARPPNPLDFDNRSISFTSDFPSANFLMAQGITRALLIQKDRLEPRADLAHSLRRWQDGGIRLERLQLELLVGPEPFEVARPSWYGAMFQRVLTGLGLRHAWGSGFGAWMPDSSSGG